MRHTGALKRVLYEEPQKKKIVNTVYVKAMGESPTTAKTTKFRSMWKIKRRMPRA